MLFALLQLQSTFLHCLSPPVAAYTQRDVRHLHPVDIFIPLYHVAELVFSVHCHQRVAVLIQKQETFVPVHHLFIPGRLPVLNDALKAPRHIIRHENLPCACIGLGRFPQSASYWKSSGAGGLCSAPYSQGQCPAG